MKSDLQLWRQRKEASNIENLKIGNVLGLILKIGKQIAQFWKFKKLLAEFKNQADFHKQTSAFCEILKRLPN